MKRRILVIQAGFLGLVLLLATSVVGCDGICPPTPTPTSTSTPTPIPTPTPTPTPTPPSEPAIDPPGPEITVAAGKIQPVRANAVGAEGYRWELLEPAGGRLSTEGPGDVTIYSAPEQAPEGGAIALLTVAAYNQGGESAKTSLIIKIPPRPPAITIMSPLDKAVCPLNEVCRFDVSGTSFRVATDPNAQVLVFVRDGDMCFPYKRVAFDNEEGRWHKEVTIGNEPCLPAGYDVEIVALAVTEDQITEYPTEPQLSLPKEFIARSNSVYLATTYAPVLVDLREAVPRQSDDNNTIAITERSDRSLTFDYHLEGGWTQIEIEVHPQDIACMRNAGLSIAFSLECTGAVNTFEVKLEDADGTSCVWRGKTVTDGPEPVESPLSYRFDECFGDGEMNWQGVRKVIFVVADHPEDEGGEGRVIISDMTIGLPAAP